MSAAQVSRAALTQVNVLATPSSISPTRSSVSTADTKGSNRLVTNQASVLPTAWHVILWTLLALPGVCLVCATYGFYVALQWCQTPHPAQTAILLLVLMLLCITRVATSSEACATVISIWPFVATVLAARISTAAQQHLHSLWNGFWSLVAGTAGAALKLCGMLVANTEAVRSLLALYFLCQLWASIQVIVDPAIHLGTAVSHQFLGCFASAVIITSTGSTYASAMVQVCATSMVQMCAWLLCAYWLLFFTILAGTVCLVSVIALCSRLLVAVLPLAASATEYTRALAQQMLLTMTDCLTACFWTIAGALKAVCQRVMSVCNRLRTTTISLMLNTVTAGSAFLTAVVAVRITTPAHYMLTTAKLGFTHMLWVSVGACCELYHTLAEAADSREV